MRSPKLTNLSLDIKNELILAKKTSQINSFSAYTDRVK